MKVEPVNRRNTKQKIFFAIFGVILFLYALSVILPFMWVFLQSFRKSAAFYDNQLSLSGGLDFGNYAYAFFQMTYKKTNFAGMFLNNVVLAAEMTVAMIVFPTMTAYVISKYPFKICKVMLVVALAITVIPTIGSLPAMYKLTNTLHMRNNFLLIWLLNASGFGFNFFILYSGFQSISWTYAEAGKIDGASNFRIFLQIMLPQAMPFLISVAITSFITNWNDYLTAFLYMDKKPTLSLGLYELGQKLLYESGNITPLFAGIILSLIPTVALFMVFQKAIMKNMSVGGIKG